MLSKRRAAIHGWLLLLPAVVLLIGFTHLPTMRTVIDSLFSTGTVIRPRHFVGLDTYARVLEDPVFRQVLGNTLLFALGTVPAGVALAMVMALLVNGSTRTEGAKRFGRSLFRLAYFTPTMLPMIAVANIWLFFYTPDIGLLDQIGTALGLGGHNWLGDPDTVLPCLMVMTVWKEAGFFMIFYLAALQTLPPELLEAARLEGCGHWSRFWKVTFPLLMPTTVFVLVNAVLNAFKLVDHLFILTKGGPDNASNLLLYYIYEAAFSFFDLSYAATLTVLLLALLAVLGIGQFLLLDKRTHYR